MTWAPITVDATHFYLQVYFWIIVAVLGGLFLLMTFVQGGQTLFHTSKTEMEERAILNSLGRKWELTFTTLVLFGGALYAAFPLFYSVSFGGAYWVWMLILFAFVLQAVSYEYMNKPNNLIGKGAYKFFLYFNGVVGMVLIGAAVGTFFTGSNFTYDPVTRVLEWGTAKDGFNLRGLEAAIDFKHGAWFNLAMGVLVFAAARILGALWLINDIDNNEFPELIERLRGVVKRCFVILLVALLVVLYGLLTLKGYAYDIHDPTGKVYLEPGKYLHNLLSFGAIPLILFLAGLVLFVWGVFVTAFKGSNKGIWFSGLGIVLIGIIVFVIAGLFGTPFYPSYADLQSSLTIQNSSGSKYTLEVMAWVSVAVPFVLGYIIWVWYQMKKQGPITREEIQDPESHAY
ncbi:cytochrome d ubiquinol oxidase subunit II [Caminibacter pacificus]|uniref:Cytochrome bd-I ubiquinol oxidase subunit 2 apoprotein n=1 Tax=Caminibacter pacificus TaxID=1424653 RepID=A0AAJ4RBB4_9BACT|nr:cytochrome d ubiquinol oxidase subunit II [Caminibacter pacificus]QCI27483.1 cytochrome d ubiquinol oxidase subunit II [Caminibacter pacificus]ROR38922.1 cytochrome bd-I ubiquinol oxidase subunit 2 apoprotein [Caminibacter pacificus]